MVGWCGGSDGGLLYMLCIVGSRAQTCRAAKQNILFSLILLALPGSKHFLKKCVWFETVSGSEKSVRFIRLTLVAARNSEASLSSSVICAFEITLD